MLAKIYVPLKSVDSRYPSNETIQRAFSEAGFDQNGVKKSGLVKLETGKNAKSVRAGSVEHHKLLIEKNLDAATTAEKDLFSRFGVYCGAYTPGQANIFAARVDDQTLIVYCQQVDPSLVRRTAAHLVTSLQGRAFKKLTDKSNMSSHEPLATMVSGDVGTEVQNGRPWSWRSELAENRRSDLILLILTVLAFFICFSAAQGSAIAIAQDGPAITFAKKAWPSLLVASGTLFLTLIIALLPLGKPKLVWEHV